MEKRRAWVQGGLGTSTTLHARHLKASRESSSRSEPAAGHAARATCFFTLVLAPTPALPRFFLSRAFSVLL
jgi:hypothetical protein